MRKAIALSFSTIAVVVALLVALLMLSVFFTRGFGTAEEKVADIRDKPLKGIGCETEAGGSLDIEDFVSKSSKAWCIGSCTTWQDCCADGVTQTDCKCKCVVPAGGTEKKCAAK